MNYIKHFVWFMKESYSFMRGHNKLWVTVQAIPKAARHAKVMSKWDKLTPAQREAWYVSGEGRTLEF
jgi:hypothetical protein